MLLIIFQRLRNKFKGFSVGSEKYIYPEKKERSFASNSRARYFQNVFVSLSTT